MLEVSMHQEFGRQRNRGRIDCSAITGSDAEPACDSPHRGQIPTRKPRTAVNDISIENTKWHPPELIQFAGVIFPIDPILLPSSSVSRSADFSMVIGQGLVSR